MTTMPEAQIRVRVDPTNPGQFFACCGLLELADRLWGGAEGWFADRGGFFCVSPTDPLSSSSTTAASLIDRLRSCRLENTMTPEQIERRGVLSAMGKTQLAAQDVLEQEKKSLDKLWREAPLVLRDPFHLLLDWFTDERAGGDTFKTWAGQQSVIDIARDLKAAVDGAAWNEPQLDWLFARTSCEGLPFNFDADLGANGSDRDVGFSFDPLKSLHVRIRPLVELLAFVGLQRFRPCKPGKENRYRFSLWFDPLVPPLAGAAASGLLGSPSARTFEFRLLYRTDYLKSFLPAVPRGDQA
jgi:CRISPR-associated protein Csb3